ncbi:STAS domain-containing protein [Priestia megaterium]|jgi:rsbT co-antagonist protein RsbR|uniref:STAS domain-containing protein n=3 Tax=Priestia megaterium TaxID=1404 RepID=A0A6M6DZF8_PRIMG|nr:STAS domain-containing protein [Priestia megaterium]AJI23942.1 STAS domain protein [Priestia megaterium NBRC 15308 = ATCC 14581]KFM97546.1 STAS domain protein [Priestia megaterium]KGJ78511.1 anti-sigma-factor antagonist [Priestia megaterium NBRC 15308 = ATCC 14581]KLV28909.1 anti-sigma-factor antagonist [Priestia megaterium]MCE4090097.1 STAS domain-containing protein [Priestia megaterium]
MDNLHFLGEKILEKKYEIAKMVHVHRRADLKEVKDVNLTDEEIIELRANFISYFGRAIMEKLDQKTLLDQIVKWGKQSGEFASNLGVSLNEALEDTTYYRTFIWEILKEEIKKNNMSIDTVFELSSIIDPLLDKAVFAFSLTYVNIHHETLKKAKSAFLELSVPVVPITKGIAVLPLVGEVDPERATLLLEETLEKANILQLSHLLFDLSGVMIVDTMVAHQIFKIVEALGLLGVKTILIGIRPEVAQTMIQLGIDFSKITIKANLEQALLGLNLTIDSLEDKDS